MAKRVLVSNDDGINAPGLRALVTALSKQEGVKVYVCAPSEEQSGQSHAISLRRFLACHPRHSDVEGAVAAYAVDGACACVLCAPTCSSVYVV
jgi:5'-nucleotidase